MKDRNVNAIAMRLTAREMRFGGDSFAAAQLELAANLITEAEEKIERLENAERAERGRRKQYAQLMRETNKRATAAEFSLNEALRMLSEARDSISNDDLVSQIDAVISCVNAGCITTAERNVRATQTRAILTFIRNRADTMSASDIADAAEKAFYRKRVGV